MTAEEYRDEENDVEERRIKGSIEPGETTLGNKPQPLARDEENASALVSKKQLAHSEAQ